jgi:hypothetical protein
MKFRSRVIALSAAALLTPWVCMAGDKPSADAAAAKKKSTAPCDHVTGSRIRPSAARNCESSVRPFRSYSAEELQQAGEINLDEALRKIDPVFR